MPSIKLYPCDSLIESYSGVLVNHYYHGHVHGMPSKSDLPNVYNINTNEIPGELCGENIISSHVKTKGRLSSYRKKSPMLWLHNKQCLSRQENIGLVFQFFFVQKNISLVLFASSRDHAISSTFEPLLTATSPLVCYTAVFRVVTQRHGCEEERCVTTLKTAVQQTTSPQQPLFLADSVVSASLPKVAVVETFNRISLTEFGYNQQRRNFPNGVRKIITTDLLYLKCTENGK